MYSTLWEQILTFLDGRKAKFLGIAAIIIGLASLKGWLDSDVSVAILSILNIIAGSASVATNKILGARNSLGQRVPSVR